MYKSIPILLAMVSFHPSSSIVIDCTYEFRHLYYCHGTVIHGDMNPNITKVIGNHIGNRTLADVDSVRLILQSLTSFPGKIEEFFPKVTKIDLSQNDITRITNAEIRNIPRLKDLSLYKNNIAELVSDLLQGMCYIKFLDLDNNKIQHVGLDFELPEKTVLLMQHNPCINAVAVGELEVQRMKVLFRIKCPPVGVEPLVIDEIDSAIPAHIRRQVDIQTMHSRMESIEERLKLLETTLANAVEIKIQV